MVAEWLCTGFNIKQSIFSPQRWSIASCSSARYCKLHSVSPIADVNMWTGWGGGEGNPAYELVSGRQWLPFTRKPLVKIVMKSVIAL